MPDEHSPHEITVFAVMVIVIAFMAILLFSSVKADAKTKDLTIAQQEHLVQLEVAAFRAESRLGEAERVCQEKFRTYTKAKQDHDDALSMSLDQPDLDRILADYILARDESNAAIDARSEVSEIYNQATQELREYMIKIGLLAAPTSREEI